MTDIVFVRTRHNYDSYQDFFKLVELSNFSTCYVDEVDVSKPLVYIVTPMNGEWRPHINNQNKDGKIVNAHLILWNLERPSGSTGSVGEYGRQCRYLIYGLWENGKEVNGNGEKSYGRFVDDVWVSDRRLAQETKLRFIVLGSDSGLGLPSKEKQYSICHMSYLGPDRRRGLFDKLKNEKISIGPNCWPPERDEILKKSRFAVNVHQDSHPFQEPLRFALFAAYGLPIITETIYDSYPWSDEFMVYSDYDGIIDKIKSIVNENYDRYEEMGLKARERMCYDFQFGDMVRQTVAESVGDWR